MTSDLAVQNDHMLGVRVQPGLHGFAHRTDLIERRSVHVRPTEVMNLKKMKISIEGAAGHLNSSTKMIMRPYLRV